jgi:glycosyltransferase involved in cell wall biosynthesis
MRIAEFVSARVLNGAARNCLAIAEALAERGHEVQLFHRPELDLQIDHSRGIALSPTDFDRSPRELVGVARALGRFEADVVHTHMSSAHAYGAILRQFWRVPTVATAHARHFQLHWSFNDRVIAPSRSTAAYHRRVNWIPGRKLEVIPNFIAAARRPVASPRPRAVARRRLGLDADALVIGSIADIITAKRPAELVHASRPLLEEGAVLVIAGAELDPAEADRIHAAAQGLEGRVRLLGRRADIPDLLPAFDLFALASAKEEMPMAVLEAMAARLPVLAVDVGGMDELVIEGETGFLVQPHDVAAMSDRLGRLASDPELRARLGAAGRKRALDVFGRDPIVDRIEAVLAEAAALRPGWRGKREPSPLAGFGRRD